MKNIKQERMTFVIVKGKKIPTKDVVVMDIQEDIQGADVAIFKYKGRFYQSRVYAD